MGEKLRGSSQYSIHSWKQFLLEGILIWDLVMMMTQCYCNFRYCFSSSISFHWYLSLFSLPGTAWKERRQRIRRSAALLTWWWEDTSSSSCLSSGSFCPTLIGLAFYNTMTEGLKSGHPLCYCYLGGLNLTRHFPTWGRKEISFALDRALTWPLGNVLPTMTYPDSQPALIPNLL